MQNSSNTAQVSPTLRQPNRQTFWLAFGFVVLLWTLLYLPGLGGIELKGEEPRRVLPGRDMIRFGDWLQPKVGGENYFNKPPLINWLVAASFLVTGQMTEWTARLPSVLSVLAMSLTLLTLPHRWLRLRTRLFASVIFLSFISMWDKGRLIEIEAAYIFLTGLACLLWIDGLFVSLPQLLTSSGQFKKPASRRHRLLSALTQVDVASFRLWLPAAAILGVGLILKGPPIVLFYYAIVLMVLWSIDRFELVVQPAHLLSILLAVLPTVLWASSIVERGDADDMTERWYMELLGRFYLGFLKFRFDEWLQLILSSMINLVPWAFFIPLLFSRQVRERIPENLRPIFRGILWGCLIPFLILAILPGSRPRYCMPVLPLVALLLGLVLDYHELSLLARKRWRLSLFACSTAAAMVSIGGLIFVCAEWPYFIITSASLVLAGLLFFAHRWLLSQSWLVLAGALSLTQITLLTVGIHHPLLARKAKYKLAAAQIELRIPTQDPVKFYRIGVQALPFYARTNQQYVLHAEQLMQGDRLVLRSETLPELENEIGSKYQLEVIFEFSREMPGELKLVHVR